MTTFLKETFPHLKATWITLSESVETRLKALGWDGKQPRASIIIHFESKMVKHVQIAISGTKEIGKALASTLWGPEYHKDSYVKFESIDLAHPSALTPCCWDG